jgi:hypothetical protein
LVLEPDPHRLPTGVAAAAAAKAATRSEVECIFSWTGGVVGCLGGKEGN